LLGEDHDGGAAESIDLVEQRGAFVHALGVSAGPCVVQFAQE
jgi:hypothetical protein